MKTNSLLGTAALMSLAWLSTLNPQLSASPLCTAFTYQGRLVDSGSPASGSYDLKFSLFDAPIGGNELSAYWTNTVTTSVSNGGFSVTLDFGAVFDGNARWLELGVRSNGVAADFTVLLPRQRLTPTPYALFASNSATLGGQPPAAYAPASGSSAYVARSGDAMTGTLNLPANGLVAGGNQLVLSGGNVGIGTATPTAALDVNGEGRLWSLNQPNVWGSVAMNATWDGGSFTWRRLGDGYASLMQQSGSEGGLNWGVADTGSAGSPVSWRYPLRLTKEGDVVIDWVGANTNGTLSGGLRFGWSGSGEGIASKRSDGGNQWGLDLYTANQTRLSIANNGNVGIGTTNPQSALDVNGIVNAQGFGGNWQVVTGDLTAQPNRAYLVNSASLVTVTLPASAAVGDTLRISGAGAGGWKLAQNAGHRIQTRNLGLNGIGNVWTARESSREWRSVASSADGTKLVAVASNDRIYTSADSGVTWTPRETSRSWQAVASSADGTKLVAAVWDGQIYTSIDAGVSWPAHESSRYWWGVASSADGTKLVAAAWTGHLYTSANSGVSWTARENNRMWFGVASSADATKLAAVDNLGQIYTSTDSGVNWVARESNREWYGVASSADGSKLVAVANNDRIYTSIDSGVTWTPRETSRYWRAIASSADGTKLVAVADGSQIYTSIDSGVTWAPRETSRSWRAVASSADGTKLVAVAYGGQIFTSTPTTTTGPAGYLTGDQYSALKLQYIGGGDWLPLSYVGNLTPF